jgi:hypothetical protein
MESNYRWVLLKRNDNGEEEIATLPITSVAVADLDVAKLVMEAFKEESKEG